MEVLCTLPKAMDIVDQIMAQCQHVPSTFNVAVISCEIDGILDMSQNARLTRLL